MNENKRELLGCQGKIGAIWRVGSALAVGFMLVIFFLLTRLAAADEQNPSISLTAPADQSIVTTFSPNLEALVSDGGSGPISVSVYGAKNQDNLSASQLCALTVTASPAEIDCSFSAPAIEPDADTILLWHFDNRSEFGENSTVVHDFSQFGNNGRVRNSPVFEPAGGRLGGVYALNGTNQDIVIADPATDEEFNTGSAVTLEAWVKRSSIGTGGDIISKYNDRSATRSYNLSFDVNDELYMLISSNGWLTDATFVGDLEDDEDGHDVLLSGTNKISDYNWHHVAGTYQYNEASDYGAVNLYIDGVNTVRNEYVAGPIHANNTIVQVGSRYWGGYLAARIDEVAIHRRALSAEEILHHYQLGYGVYYWKVAAGNEESETWSFRIAAAPEVLSLDSPPAGACLNTTAPELTATLFDDEAGDQVYGFFNILPSGSNSGSGQSTVFNTTAGQKQGQVYCRYGEGCLSSLTEGSYQWLVKAQDSYGLESDYTETRTFDLDWTGPENASVQIDEGGAGTPDLAVVLTLNAADARHNEGMQIRITGDVDPADPNYNIWQDYVEELEVELSGGTGEKNITVEFKDVCGNIASAAATTGYSTPPAVLSLDAPEDGVCLNTLSPALTATLSDQDEADEVYGFFNILPAGSHEGTGNSTAFDVALEKKEGQVSCGETGDCLTELVEGSYQWQVKAIDKYGLESEWSELRNFDIDIAEPSDLSVIINSGQAQTMQREVVVAIEASDAHGEGLQVKFSGDIDQGYLYYNVWQARQDFFNLTLTDGYGLKTITVEFQDDCGNIISYEDYIESEGPPPGGGGGPGPYIYYGDLPYAYDLQPANNESWGGDEETYDDMIFSWRFADPNDLYQQQSFQIGVFRVADDSAVYESGSWAANSEDSYNEALDRYYYSVNDISGLAIGGQYYWRIKVKDTGDGASDWSGKAYFYTNHRPDGYALDWPAEGELIASANPSLTISLGEDFDNDAIFYKFEIYEIANAGDEVGELVETSEWLEVNVPPHAYVVTNSLVEDWYRWRVYAKDEHNLPSTPEYLSSHFQISNPPPVNQPPAAVIDYTGPLYILAGESAILDGTSSYDPEFCQAGDKETAGACLLYQWYVNGALASREESFILQTAPDISQMYQIVLMVQDLGGRYSDYGGSCVGYDHWACLSSLINVGYCGDFILQEDRGEACDAAYDLESGEKLSGDDEVCPGLCQESCLCPAELDLPKWREVRPR